MTLQDTRHNEPDGGTDSLVYLCENCPGRIDNTAPSVEDQRFDAGIFGIDQRQQQMRGI